MMMMMKMMIIIMMTLADGWIPPHGGKQAQGDTVLKLIAIHFTEIQNCGRC